jgi:thymidylate synthase
MKINPTGENRFDFLDKDFELVDDDTHPHATHGVSI